MRWGCIPVYVVSWMIGGCGYVSACLTAVRFGETYRVINGYAPGQNIVEPSAYQLTPYCGQVVGEDLTFKMIALVLDYACQISGNLLIVFVEVFIEPL